MTEKLRRNNERLLTIEELADQAGISRELMAKLIKEKVIVPVGDKASLDGMRFHESAVRVIERWEEEDRLVTRK